MKGKKLVLLFLELFCGSSTRISARCVMAFRFCHKSTCFLEKKKKKKRLRDRTQKATRLRLVPKKWSKRVHVFLWRVDGKTPRPFQINNGVRADIFFDLHFMNSKVGLRTFFESYCIRPAKSNGSGIQEMILLLRSERGVWFQEETKLFFQ